MKRFRCVTFGCRLNQYESQAIREQLTLAGYVEVPEGSPLDLLVVNTCTVTKMADRECLALVKQLHRAHPKAEIVLAGCLVQQDAPLLKGLPGVRLLVGTNQKHRIAELLATLEEDPWGWEPRVELQLERVYAPLRISSFDGRSKAFLKVQDGCDRACAFCKIPLVRGRSRSRSIPEIVEELRRLVDRGYKEITLTGVALGLWGKEWDPPMRLADLIYEADRLPGNFRIRLSSLDPRDLDDRLMEVLRDSTKLCRHLHLSLQSGSDGVLRRMNRGYRSSWYEERVKAIRGFWPDLGLTTDWIVGFPGETDQEFHDSLDFCQRLLFAKVHVFPFSPRRGTRAFEMKDPVPPGEIKARARILRKTAEEAASIFRERFVGTTQEVLVEEANRGYTSQFLPVELSAGGNRDGQLLAVEIVGTNQEGLLGKISVFNP